MRKIAIALAITAGAVMSLTQVVHAGQIYNNDMAGSKMAVVKVCAPPAEFVGVVTQDRENSDAADAVTAICYSSAQGEFEIPNGDFGDRAKVRAKCNRATEYVWGIAYKDRVGSDEADGVTVICRNKSTGAQRIVFIQDLAGGKAYVQFTGKNAIGVAYNDRQGSDSMDGATLVTK